MDARDADLPRLELDVFPGDGGITGERLQAFKELSYMVPDVHDVPNVVLTAAHQKPMSWVDVAARTQDELFALTTAVNDLGLNCAMDWDTGDGLIYTGMIVTPEPIYLHPDSVKDNSDGYVLDELAIVFNGKNTNVAEVERRKGELLGYPEYAVEAHIVRQNGETVELCSGHDMADLFQDTYELTAVDRQKLDVLSNYSAPLTVDAFEDMLELVEERYATLETLEQEHSVTLTDFDEYYNHLTIYRPE